MGLLTGIRVLDLSRVMSGPYCTALLADLGAEVIKVETPGTGDDARTFGPFIGGESVYFAVLNRHKKSVSLNLKQPRAQALAADLAAKSDVVVENFRPGVAKRLGVDAQTLRARNPRLVYLSITGFGQDGPLASWPAYDLIIQAMSGLMSTTGDPAGSPTAVGESIADVWTGLYGSWAVLAALLHRERSGEGQAIDLGMLDSLLAMQLTGLSRIAAEGRAPQRVGNRHPVTAPVDTFRASDGHVALVVTANAPFAALCDLMGEPALAQDARYADNASRRDNVGELKRRIESWTAGRTMEEIVGACQTRGIPAGPVWDLQQAFDSPQARVRGTLTQVPHSLFGTLALACQPAKFSGHESVAATREPALGQHTDEVLRDLLGMSAAQTNQLRADRII